MLVLIFRVGHLVDELAECPTGARMHADATQCRKRQHRPLALRVGVDEQVPATFVAKRELGESDDDVPFAPTSLVLQPAQRGLDILGPDGERLAQDFHVPVAASVTARWLEVTHPARDLGRCGGVGHEADLDQVHLGRLSLAILQ